MKKQEPEESWPKALVGTLCFLTFGIVNLCYGKEKLGLWLILCSSVFLFLLRKEIKLKRLIEAFSLAGLLILALAIIVFIFPETGIYQNEREDSYLGILLGAMMAISGLSVHYILTKKT